jgi:hypothetical protein
MKSIPVELSGGEIKDKVNINKRLIKRIIRINVGNDCWEGGKFL